MKNKLFFVLPVVLAGAVLAYFISQRSAPEKSPAREQVRHVRIIEAQETEIIPRVLGFGSVKPGKEWSATGQVSGEIEYVHPDLKKGAILTSGTEIIRISPADFELSIAQAEANIRATEAKLKELSVTQVNTRQVLDIEKRALRIREQELGRQRALLKRGTVSQTSFDRATRDTLSQRKTVQELENSLRLIPTQRTVQDEQIAVYQAQLQSAKLDLARTSIRLPFDARIAEVNAEVAQLAQKGQTLATADGVETAEVEAQVPIARFFNMAHAVATAEMPRGITSETLKSIANRMGFEVTIRLKAGDQVTEWPARFARISDTIDPKTRTIGVIAVVDGPYAQAIPGKRPPLAKGLFVEMELRASAQGKRLIVPRSALHDGKLYIANNDNRLEIRPVETGLYQGDIVTIRKGLNAGDRVVVSDLSPAIAGALLKTTPDDSLSEEIRREASSRGPSN